MDYSKVIKTVVKKVFHMEHKSKDATANDIIKNHVLWSAGAGMVIPLPIVDMLAVASIQMDMLKQLCQNYEVKYSEHHGKALISTLIGTGIAKIGARQGIRMVTKMIPGIGAVLGGLSMAVMSGASTYALGEVFKLHLNNGGDMSDLVPEQFKAYYEEKLEQGKKITEKWRKETTAPAGEAVSENEMPTSASNDTISQLKELADLYKEGILTDAEFTAMKAKILQ